MAASDLRDPAADRRRARRHGLAVVAVAATAVVAASYVTSSTRPLDHTYVFYLEYGNENGAPYTLLVPLPADPEVQATWRFLGNGTAAQDTSAYGPVVRVESWSNITVTCRLVTWKDLAQGLSTEGTSAGGRVAARAFLETTGASVGSFLNITYTKADPTWTTSRYVQGDLFEGWNTIEVRQTQERTVSR